MRSAGPTAASRPCSAGSRTCARWSSPGGGHIGSRTRTRAHRGDGRCGWTPTRRARCAPPSGRTWCRARDEGRRHGSLPVRRRRVRGARAAARCAHLPLRGVPWDVWADVPSLERLSQNSAALHGRDSSPCGAGATGSGSGPAIDLTPAGLVSQASRVLRQRSGAGTPATSQRGQISHRSARRWPATAWAARTALRRPSLTFPALRRGRQRKPPTRRRATGTDSRSLGR